MAAPKIIELDADDPLRHNETPLRLTHALLDARLAPWADAALIEDALAERRAGGMP